MAPVYLLSIASRQSEWLATRQSVIAENIANANTPRFKAGDTEPFEAILDKTQLTVASTNPLHMSDAAESARQIEVRREDAWDVVHSGNTVVLEQELLKAGETSRQYALNTGIVKAFHRMFMASVKV
jgi:flagellar basal-body rod protein FlgB